MSSGIEFPQRLNDLDKGSSGQAGLSLGLSGLRVFEDPPGLHDKVRDKYQVYLPDVRRMRNVLGVLCLYSTHRKGQLAASAFKYCDWMKVLVASLRVGFCDKWKRAFSENNLDMIVLSVIFFHNTLCATVQNIPNIVYFRLSFYYVNGFDFIISPLQERRVRRHFQHLLQW